jgi:hypothetical protein
MFQPNSLERLKSVNGCKSAWEIEFERTLALTLLIIVVNFSKIALSDEFISSGSR